MLEQRNQRWTTLGDESGSGKWTHLIRTKTDTLVLVIATYAQLVKK